MTIQIRSRSVRRCALWALAFLGCGGSEAPADQAPADQAPASTDPGDVEALTPACPEAAVFEPGVFSLPDQHEYRVAFTPDGQTAFFARSTEFFPESREATLYMSELEDGVWSTPVVAPFSGVYPDLDPFVSSDGERVYFSSIRPVAGQERTDVDVWVVERSGDGFGEPENLGPAVNSENDELFPSVTDAGDIYFGSDRAGGAGAFDVWRTRLSVGASEPENLGPSINTEGLEFNPWVSPDGHVLLFTGLNRAGGYGAGDLYASIDLGAGFGGGVNLGPCVNTSADEYHAAPRVDRWQLFFVRLHFDPVWIPGDLYVVDLHRLGLTLVE